MLWKRVATLLLLLMPAVLLVSCDDDNTAASTGEAIINGLVKDNSSGSAIAGASVLATSLTGGSQSQTTDTEGRFSFSFTVDSTDQVSITISKSGYRDSTFTVPVASGNVATLTLGMTPRSPIVPGGGTGQAQTIAFLGATPREVTVYGVGGQETAILGYEVRDSVGNPIDLANAVNIDFSLRGAPGGGEYLSPPSVRTNSIGRTYTTFNAGIRSGVAQVVARTTVGSRTIESAPIRVIIAAGYPDQAHFTLSAARYNFPALNFVGKRLQIGVLVGDRYSNPVAPGTAVYFNSEAGVVQPSVFTSTDGTGNVDLISGNPYPLGVYAYNVPGFGDGYHVLQARTVGQTGTPVADSVVVLWSGFSQVTGLTPSTFFIQNGGQQTFSFNVADGLGHPLCAGTVIAVSAFVPPPPSPNTPVNQVQLSFGDNGRVTLPDVITGGPGRTQFSFVLSDGTNNIIDSVGTAVSLTVSVISENGNTATSITGRVR